MKKETSIKMNNKGFSLVELIIVIAIMAVLIGIMAPQFLKYVEKSRRATDVTNAQQIASVLSASYSDEEFLAADLDTDKTFTLANFPAATYKSITSFPSVKSKAAGAPTTKEFTVHVTKDGAVTVKAGTVNLYPKADVAMTE